MKRKSKSSLKALAPLISADEVGKLFGWTGRRIRQLAGDGSLPRTIHGRWETMSAIMAKAGG